MSATEGRSGRKYDRPPEGSSRQGRRLGPEGEPQIASASACAPPEPAPKVAEREGSRRIHHNAARLEYPAFSKVATGRASTAGTIRLGGALPRYSLTFVIHVIFPLALGLPRQPEASMVVIRYSHGLGPPNPRSRVTVIHHRWFNCC